MSDEKMEDTENKISSVSNEVLEWKRKPFVVYGRLMLCNYFLYMLRIN